MTTTNLNPALECHVCGDPILVGETVAIEDSEHIHQGCESA